MWEKRRGSEISYNILLYVSINSNRKSVFLLFSIPLCFGFIFQARNNCTCRNFPHNANNITKVGGGLRVDESKKRFFFVKLPLLTVGHCTSIV